MFKQGDSQINFLPSDFTAKCKLAFASTQENPYLCRFHFKANRRSITSSKKTPPFKTLAYCCVIITEDFERLPYFNFRTNFLKVLRFGSETFPYNAYLTTPYKKLSYWISFLRKWLFRARKIYSTKDRRLFQVCWNIHLVNYFSLMHRCVISTSLLLLTFP